MWDERGQGAGAGGRGPVAFGKRAAGARSVDRRLARGAGCLSVHGDGGGAQGGGAGGCFVGEIGSRGGYPVAVAPIIGCRGGGIAGAGAYLVPRGGAAGRRHRLGGGLEMEAARRGGARTDRGDRVRRLSGLSIPILSQACFEDVTTRAGAPGVERQGFRGRPARRAGEVGRGGGGALVFPKRGDRRMGVRRIGPADRGKIWKKPVAGT